MKKRLSLLLALIMTFCTLPALAEDAPALSLADLPGLPEGSYTPLGGGRVLVVDYYTPLFAVYDTQTGQLTPLHALEEDLTGWMELYSIAMVAEGELITAQELTDQYVRQGSPELLPYIMKAIGITVVITGPRYAACAEGFVLDTETGLARPASPDIISAQNLFADENIMHCEVTDGLIRLTLSAPDGSVLREASIPVGSEWPLVMGGVSLTDGFLFTLMSGKSADNTRHLALICTDGSLAWRTIDLGTWHNNALNVQLARRSASTGKLLLMTTGRPTGKNVKTINSETGRITLSIEPDGPWLEGLLAVDVDSGAVQRIDSSDEPLALLGMSADGSCALLCDAASALYRLDMETLALTQIMSAAAVKEVIAQALPAGMPGGSLFFYSRLPWDGGEYMVYPFGVFRVDASPAHP